MNNANEKRDPATYELDMWLALPGIAIAGGAYLATNVFVSGVALSFFNSSFSVNGLVEVVAFFVGCLLYAAMAAVFGVIYGLFAGVIALIVVSSFAWSTGIRFPERTPGSLAGGLAGFWSMVIPFIMIKNSVPDISNIGGEYVIYLMVGPMTAMCFGYIGVRLCKVTGWFAKYVWIERATFVADQAQLGSPCEFQVSVSGLFRLTIWAAVITAIVQTTKAASATLCITLAVYIIAQSLLLATDLFLLGYMRRRVAR